MFSVISVLCLFLSTFFDLRVKRKETMDPVFQQKLQAR